MLINFAVLETNILSRPILRLLKVAISMLNVSLGFATWKSGRVDTDWIMLLVL